ncbi:hypothetical protein Ga0074812_12138 [Parafrankia irregularis]|uniref:Uncharacterized protein n=1 Tax=Parafrankia irregularis TaxID=795642 RepID=A0A0S4QW58_9ACTN|nr:hypothetical protein Ga0074812_12138 [Parafrankia irregularis]
MVIGVALLMGGSLLLVGKVKHSPVGIEKGSII